jgi:hypothetical protein
MVDFVNLALVAFVSPTLVAFLFYLIAVEVVGLCPLCCGDSTCLHA